VLSRYRIPDFMVISLHADSDNPCPIHHGPSSTRRREAFREHFPNEARTPSREHYSLNLIAPLDISC
jgi:hypothetical protein